MDANTWPSFIKTCGILNVGRLIELCRCSLGYQHFFRILRHFNTWIGIVDWSQISSISINYWSTTTTTHERAYWNHYIRAHLLSKFNWLVGLSGSIFFRDIWDLWSVYNTNPCIEVLQESKKYLQPSVQLHPDIQIINDLIGIFLMSRLQFAYLAPFVCVFFLFLMGAKERHRVIVTLFRSGKVCKESGWGQKALFW